MKTLKNFLLVAVAVAAVSCAEEIAPEINVAPEAKLVPMTFTASADMDEDTKAAYNEGLTIWNENDEIAVVKEDGTLLGTFKASEVNGASATFSAMVNEELVNLDETNPKYYAVYPASAYQGCEMDFTVKQKVDGVEQEVKKPRLFINIPQNQTAVAGSFDPKAFVSVATNNGGHLAFKNLCSVIKFKFTNAENVQSIKFTVNGNTNLAGTGNVYTSNLTTHAWGDDFTGRTAYNTINLSAPAEGWKADTDYYFTLRPFKQTVAEGQNQDPAKTGIKFYVDYNNGLKIREGANAFDAIRNKIHSAGTIDVEGKLNNITLIDAYNNGMEINIAGTIITKKAYGDATRIKNDSSNKTISQDGVYFVDSDAEGVTITHNPKKTIIISNDPAQATLKRGASTFRLDATANNDYLIMSNINFSTGMTSGNMISGGGAGDFETIIFNKCKIEVPAGMLMLYSSLPILNLNLTDCDVKLHTGTADKNLVQTSATNTYATLVFKNNIFYSTDGDLSNFRLFTNTNATIANLEFRNNTIAGIYCKAATGYISAKTINSANVISNLIYLPKYNDYLSGQWIGILYLNATGQLATEADKNNAEKHLTMLANLAYYNYATLPAQRAKCSYYSNNGTMYSKYGEANPIPAPDYVNGVFTTVDKGNDKFSTYGAKR